MPSNEQLTPNVQLGGLQLAWGSNTTLTISSGQTLDSLNNNNIILGSTATLNGAVKGANGIDTGTLGASALYAVYVIGSSLLLAAAPTATLISLSATAPTLPVGYDIFYRIGWAFTNGSSQFIKFYQTGTRSERTYSWDAMISVLSAGSSATFAAVDCTAAVPAVDNTLATLYVSFTPNAAGDAATFRPTGSSATTVLDVTGVVAAKAQDLQITVLTKLATGKPEFDYKVAAMGSLSVSVLGYKDYI